MLESAFPILLPPVHFDSSSHVTTMQWYHLLCCSVAIAIFNWQSNLFPNLRRSLSLRSCCIANPRSRSLRSTGCRPSLVCNRLAIVASRQKKLRLNTANTRTTTMEQRPASVGWRCDQPIACPIESRPPSVWHVWVLGPRVALAGASLPPFISQSCFGLLRPSTRWAPFGQFGSECQFGQAGGSGQGFLMDDSCRLRGDSDLPLPRFLHALSRARAVSPTARAT